ncbi:MAG: ATP--guanido phosphotransferase [Clostridiales bacterium]|nr:ATP--guanido phosphotransferase [Clostridiales bacterium]
MAQLASIQTIVTSTRIRLARNLSAYPFPQKLTPKLAKEIVYLVEHTLADLDNFQKNDIATLSEEESILLQEQHLISPALIRRKGISSAFIAQNKSISIMVNEEDHLRQQCIAKGFNLYEAYEKIVGIDEGLNERLGFAYDEKLGYLTACPSNLGTGMRASVMMFLPGLAWSKELENFIPQLKAGGLTVRGIFGEGTTAEGYSYQISNERTLGLSEEAILEQMYKMTMTLCDLELRARERMLKQNELSLKDLCMRAYATLMNCVLLPQKELASLIVKVKLGIALGFFKARNMQDFNDFIADMRPASFRLENSLQTTNETECDFIRAEIVQKVLPELVVKAK